MHTGTASSSVSAQTSAICWVHAAGMAHALRLAVLCSRCFNSRRSKLDTEAVPAEPQVQRHLAQRGAAPGTGLSHGGSAAVQYNKLQITKRVLGLPFILPTTLLMLYSQITWDRRPGPEVGRTDAPARIDTPETSAADATGGDWLDGGTDGASGVDDPSSVGMEAEITERRVARRPLDASNDDQPQAKRPRQLGSATASRDPGLYYLIISYL